jgi:TPR repeat protein
MGPVQFPYSLRRVEACAELGHEESQRIVALMKGHTKEECKEILAKSTEPMDWFFAGQLSYDAEQKDLLKKSAEAGCSWGQLMYGLKLNKEAQLEWLKKSADHGNRSGMLFLGFYYRNGGRTRMTEAKVWFLKAAQLGNRTAMENVANYSDDLKDKVYWAAKANTFHGEKTFKTQILNVRDVALGRKITKHLGGYRLEEMIFHIGECLYWDMDLWASSIEQNIFGDACVDFYCKTVDLHQQAILLFLKFWKETVGVKELGQMIARLAWKDRKQLFFEDFRMDQPPKKKKKRAKR